MLSVFQGRMAQKNWRNGTLIAGPTMYPRNNFEFHGMATSDYFVLAFQKNCLQISRLFCGAQLLAMFKPLKK